MISTYIIHIFLCVTFVCAYKWWGGSKSILNPRWKITEIKHIFCRYLDTYCKNKYLLNTVHYSDLKKTKVYLNGIKFIIIN